MLTGRLARHQSEMPQSVLNGSYQENGFCEGEGSPVHGGFVKLFVSAMDPVPNAKPSIAGVKPVVEN